MGLSDDFLTMVHSFVESSTALASTTNSLRRSSRLDLPSSKHLSPKKKKPNPASNIPRKKPTLIRNLGGASAPKGEFVHR